MLDFIEKSLEHKDVEKREKGLFIYSILAKHFEAFLNEIIEFIRKQEKSNEH
jgi:hypothetical protein